MTMGFVKKVVINETYKREEKNEIYPITVLLSSILTLVYLFLFPFEVDRQLLTAQ